MHSTHSTVIASITGIHKTFDKKPALNNVTFDIKSNQVIAILGSNGAGKTTLINILLGRLQPNAGDISVFASPAGSIKAKQQTGAMLQVAALPDTLKVKEHIELFRSYYPKPMSYQKILSYAGLEHLENRYSKKLSGGEKQRLLFALSLCGNPKLLFLDEPTVGMDITARQKLWQTIRELKAEGTAIVLTTHYLEEADSLADEVILLKEGSIIEKGSNEQIKSSVSSTLIQFITPDKPINLTNIIGVISCDIYGKYTKLQSNQGNETLIELLASEPNLQELTVTRAGLEEAFIQLDKTETKNKKDAA